ncbi:MAG: GGDEF domain-containing protein, partial [Candidatus Aegiribacteria sp.]|nr:GGDEF domain-containing protein [Candidatus Aegiribacteria sp.]
RRFPAEEVSIDNFGENPFGSRRYTIIPTEKSVIPPQTERRLHSTDSQRGNYLLIEMDSPFDNIGRAAKFFVECLCRQVGSALLLRDRESMAYIDMLTGSIIGYSWTKRLMELSEEAKSSGTPMSVLLVDVDDLREINRLFGYNVGDNTLKTVVSTIKGILRPNDMIGRLREDLFVVSLPETGGENAMIIAERICSIIAGTEIRPDRVPVTVCIGVAVYDSPEENPELMISRACAALNLGKSQGNNRAVLWSEEGGAWDFDSGMLKVFNTGDPGWDHSVSVMVLELLSTSKPSMEMVAERLRDALRSEFIYLEDGKGNSSFVGSRILRRIPEEIHEKSEDMICTHSGILGRYDVLSVRLACGGRLISAWDKLEGISESLKSIFRALATLANLLIQSESVIPGHPSPEQP